MTARARSGGLTIDFVGHATVLIAASGVRILCDPHLMEDFRGGLFAYRPARTVHLRRMPPLDAIVISHSHRDHFDVRSLACLDRRIPVFCPMDRRIHHVLSALGFREVITVDDWVSIAPVPGVTMTWTPSTYRVPEHGLAIRVGPTTVWNLVDTHVTRAWTQRTLEALECERLDALMVPCQPLLETAVVEARHPIVEDTVMHEVHALVRRCQPRFIVPFADGHYCAGAARWLNHQKFPLSRPAVDRLARSGCPRATVVWPRPGLRLELAGARKGVRPSPLALATPDPRSLDRYFHPGGWIAALASANGSSPEPACRLLRSLLEHGADPARPPLAAPIVERLGARAVTPCSYRLVTVDGRGRRSAAVSFRLTSAGRAVACDERCPDIEVALAESDLAALRSGELGFSAAFLGGRLREMAWPAARNAIVVRGVHDDPQPGAAVVLSGIAVLNLMLARWGDLETRELDVEISACRRAASPRRARAVGPDRRRAGAGRAAVGLPVADLALRALWRRIGEVIGRHRDPAEVSGYREGGARPEWFGVLGRGAWPAHGGVSTGRLFLFSLLEAQPHLGAGVRFPRESYAALIENMLASPIRHWTIACGLPTARPVPRWRLWSLLPIGRDRLVRDLRRRGWKGDVIGAEIPAASEWWGGHPRARPTGRVQSMMVWSAHGRPALGLCRGRGLAGRARRRPQDPQFRLELVRPEPGRSAGVLETLIYADLRFSWLRSPGEAAAMFGAPATSDDVAWTERAAVRALQVALRIEAS